MKVAFLVSNVVPYHHARYDCFARLKDIEATMVQVTSRDSFKSLEFHPESPNYRLHTLYPGRPFREISIRELYKKCLEYLRRYPQDVVCASGWGGPHGIALIAAANKMKIPVVVFSESNEFDFARNRLKEFIKKFTVRCCSAGLAGGTVQKEYLVKLGMSPEKIEFGHNVVSVDHFFCPDPETPREKFFFACARLEPKKNHFNLLRGYLEYRRKVDTPWQIKIAGDGFLRKDLEKLCTDHGLEPSNILPGSQTYDKLPKLYREAGAFIHPSLTEQWGLVVNEAMAAACPILVSRRCGCAPDLVKENVNGFLFDPNSVTEIAEAMLKIHNMDESRLRAMRLASRRIIADWMPDRFASGLKSCCEKALNNPARPGFIAETAVRLLLYFKRNR